MNTYIDDDINDIDEEYFNTDNFIDDEDDDCDDELSYTDFYQAIFAELKYNEVDRKTFKFKYNDNIISGIPIHKMNDSNVIFNIDGKLKKINFDLVELL